MDASKVLGRISRFAWAIAVGAAALVYSPGLLAAWEQAAGEPSPKTSRIDKEMARVATMSRAEQQTWLRQLESRFAHAVTINLSPADAVAEQKRMRTMLYRKTISWQMLRQVINETDAREKEAIEALVQKHSDVTSVPPQPRIPITDSPRYREWKDGSSDFVAQDGLIHWLETQLDSLERPTPTTTAVQKPEQTQPGKVDLKPGVAVQADKKPEVAAQQTTETKPVALPAVEPNLPVTPPSAVAGQPVISPRAKAAEKVVNNRSENSSKPTAETSSVAKRTKKINAEPSVTVQIDVDELAARIAGCNLEFRGLEIALDEKGIWNVAKLEPMVDRLKLLMLRRHDLGLFRESLSEERRASIAKLESPKVAIAQVAAKIVEIRQQVTESASRTEPERRAELERLDSLSRRLAEISVGE